MNKKKILSIILTMIMCLSAIPIKVSATEVANGTCGDNLTWVLDSNGTLTISGTGDMMSIPDVGKVPASQIPWYERRENIKKVIINEGVTDIGDYAFYECSNLIDVQIADSVTRIGKSSFSSCKFTDIDIPNSITFIDNYAFGGCSSLTDVYYSGTNQEWLQIEIGGYNGYLITTSIHYAEELDVVSGKCGENVMWTFENGTLTINGSGAMWHYGQGRSHEYQTYCYYFDDITNIVINDGVTSIGNYAFCHFDVNVGNNGVTTYGNHILSSVNIADSVTSIGERAFASCVGLTEIKLPQSLKSIDSNAFYYCKSLSDITIPPSVQSINNGAFDGCSGLTRVKISEGVEELYTTSFYKCSKLTSVTIPSTVSTLICPFSDCTALIRVVALCSDMSYANSRQFMNCNDNLIVYGYSGSFLEEVAESNGYTFEPFVSSGTFSTDLKWALTGDGELHIYGTGAIPDYASSSNVPPWNNYKRDIKKVVIGNGVTTIGSYAFEKCVNLKDMDIPASVTEINSYAFAYCTELANVYYGDCENSWDAISIGTNNQYLTKATIHYAFANPAPTVTPTPTAKPTQKPTPTPTATPTPKPDEPTPPVTDGTTVTAASVTASPGGTVNVKVDLSGNKGFANLGVQVGYDANALTITSVTNNPSVGAVYTPAQQITANPYNMGWDSTGNIAFNGTLATLTFKVKENAPEGKYPITVSYYTGKNGNYTDGTDVNYDENFNALNLNYVNGEITVSSHTPGDINGDGKVNNQDGTFLLRHLAGWNVNVDDSALDINGDGKINNQDGTVLLRYLAGWQVNIH